MTALNSIDERVRNERDIEALMAKFPSAILCRKETERAELAAWFNALIIRRAAEDAGKALP